MGHCSLSAEIGLLHPQLSSLAFRSIHLWVERGSQRWRWRPVEKRKYSKRYQQRGQDFYSYKGKSENVQEKIEKQIKKHPFHFNIVQIAPPSVKRALLGIFLCAKYYPGKGSDPLKVKKMTLKTIQAHSSYWSNDMAGGANLVLTKACPAPAMPPLVYSVLIALVIKYQR